MAERTFTLEEANAALDEIRPLAERMVEHRRALHGALERWNELTQRLGGNGGGISPVELREGQEAVQREAAAVAECVEAITGLGALVKDLDQGLVDFPSLRDDQTVLLCWHVGEDEIRYWHGLEEGFAGRKPL